MTEQNISRENQVVLPALQQNAYRIAVCIYLCILLIGIIAPIGGIIGLALLALVALFRILARNATLILILIALSFLTAFIPLLLIIYIPVLIYFFLMRLGYLFEHLMLVFVGLFTYFFPIGIMTASIGSPSIAIFLIIPTIVFPLSLKYFVDSEGYTVQKALEIMSEAPVLIVSIVLPFLKLGIGIEVFDGAGLNETVAGDSVAGDTVAKPMINEVANMRTSPIYGDAFISETPVIEPYSATLFAANSAITVNGFFQHLQQSHQVDNMDGTSSPIDSNGYQQVKIGSHGFDSLYIQNEGSQLILTDNQGETLGFIKQVGSELEIRDADMTKIGNITTESNSMNIIDKYGITVASIPEVNTDLVGTVSNSNIVPDGIDAEYIFDDNKVLNAEDEGLLLNDINKEAEQSNDNSSNHLLYLALINLLADKKDVSTISPFNRFDKEQQKIATNLDRLDTIENAEAYPKGCFYDYIEENALAYFKDNDHVYMYEEIRDKTNFQKSELETIENKFGITVDRILLIIDDAVFFKAANGIILTKDRIYIKEMGLEPQSFQLNSFKRLGSGSLFQSKAIIKRDTLYIHLGNSEAKDAYQQLILLYDRYMKAQF